MRNATCVRTQTSKDPTRVAILFISYSMPIIQTNNTLFTARIMICKVKIYHNNAPFVIGGKYPRVLNTPGTQNNDETRRIS